MSAEHVQRALFLDTVLQEPRIRKYELQSRMAAAAFILLAMRPSKLRKLLDNLADNEGLI